MTLFYPKSTNTPKCFKKMFLCFFHFNLFHFQRLDLNCNNDLLTNKENFQIFSPIEKCLFLFLLKSFQEKNFLFDIHIDGYIELI